MMKLQTAALTHPGKIREENQDSIFCRIQENHALLMVADGMGGHAGGSLASSMTVDLVQQQLDSGKTIRQALKYANSQLLKMAEQDPAYDGMGTTVTLVKICDAHAEIAQVGDSRAYLLRANTLRQLTKDHSYVQYLVDMGKLSEEEARTSSYRNMITRSLGMQGLKIDITRHTLEAGDMLLLCSDGLYEYFSTQELEQLLLRDNSLQQKAEQLTEIALARGGADNISVILASFFEEGGEYHG